MKEPYHFGLVGHRVSYSLSKVLFEAIFQTTRSRGEFHVYDIPPEQFNTQITDILSAKAQALCVTIPYKAAIIPYLAEIHPVAHALGAVNSVAVHETERHGYNTDVFGFSQPLRPYAAKLKYGHGVILGCGGSAKAVGYALYTDFEMRDLTIISRSEEKLAIFSESLRKILPGVRIQSQLTVSCADVQPYHILVNCTPLGGPNHSETLPFPEDLPLAEGKIYYDLNYNRGNVSGQAAEAHAMNVIDGSRMLVGQAIRSFALWTGRTAEEEHIYRFVFPERVPSIGR